MKDKYCSPDTSAKIRLTLENPVAASLLQAMYKLHTHCVRVLNGSKRTRPEMNPEFWLSTNLSGLVTLYSAFSTSRCALPRMASCPSSLALVSAKQHIISAD